MARSRWTAAAVALGAVLAASPVTRADDTVRLGGGGTAPGVSGGTVTLGGTGTVAQAATADDIDLACCRKYGYYYGGYYPAYYGGGCCYGYRPYYSGVTVTYYAGGYGYRPAYYGGGYYGGYYAAGPGYYGSYYRRFGADADETQAPTVNLGGPVAANPPPAAPPKPQQQPPRNANAPGTFNYDGGPAVPVPQPSTIPQPVPQPKPTPTTGDIPVSLKPQPAAPATPYKFKAYGEK